jgi:hypothetical protein
LIKFDLEIIDKCKIKIPATEAAGSILTKGLGGEPSESNGSKIMKKYLMKNPYAY